MKSLLISQSSDTLDMWLQRTHVLVQAHSYSANSYKVLHYTFGITIIILSGLINIPVIQGYYVYLSALIMIIVSVYVFFNFNEHSTRHRIASKLYGEILRLLEAQKGMNQTNAEVLQQIQDKINRANHEAPEIPSRHFERANNEINDYMKDVDQLKVDTIPSLVKNVHFVTNPIITSSDLSKEHFKLEFEYFKMFLACPADFKEFQEQYTGKNYLISEGFINNTLIGFALFEKIDNFYHLIIIVVHEGYRKQGIGKRIISNAKNLMTNQGVKHFTLFTGEEALINNLMRGIVDPVGLESILNNDELSCLRKIENSRGLPENTYQGIREIMNYYGLRDGNTLSAVFKLYRM